MLDSLACRAHDNCQSRQRACDAQPSLRRANESPSCRGSSAAISAGSLSCRPVRSRTC
jgi:hypothetical protein